MSSTSSVAALVGNNPARLEAAARAAGVRAELVGQYEIEALPCVLTNMTTADLAHVRFGAGAKRPALIVKIAQSPRHSPLWDQIPEPFHEQVMGELPWRAEADLYASPLGAWLPAEMRMPVIYAVDPLDDDHIALWMEDVEERSSVWDRDDYRMAAGALGRLAGQLPEQEIPPELPVRRRDFRAYFFGRVAQGTMPGLRDEATWRHPLVAETADSRLREDLESLADAMPALLDRLDELPRTLAHGDACPQNLLRPVGEPGIFVAIDWTFAGIAAVGLDAAQLVAGRAESGELDPAELRGVLDDVLDAYAGGLTALAPAIDGDMVRFGVIGNLVVRSAFTALPIELLGDEPTDELALLFDRRAKYARFLVDLGLDLVADRRVRL